MCQRVAPLVCVCSGGLVLGGRRDLVRTSRGEGGDGVDPTVVCAYRAYWRRVTRCTTCTAAPEDRSQWRSWYSTSPFLLFLFYVCRVRLRGGGGTERCDVCVRVVHAGVHVTTVDRPAGIYERETVIFFARVFFPPVPVVLVESIIIACAFLFATPPPRNVQSIYGFFSLSRTKSFLLSLSFGLRFFILGSFAFVTAAQATRKLL